MARLRLLAPRKPAPLTAALSQQTSQKPAGVTFGRDRPLPWQLDAWRFYDDLGMIKFYANYRANAFGKVRLYVGVRDPGGGAPIPIDDPESGIDPGLVASAMEELDLLRDPVQGQSGILHDIGLNESVVGECRLLGRDDQGPETWQVYSNAELLRNTDGRWELRSDPHAHPELLPPDAFVKRLWRPHPQRKMFADCALRGILTDCAALSLLEQDIIATAQSRVSGSGILALKKGLDGKHFDPNDGDDAEPSQFADDLLEHIMAPIRNPGSAASVAPMLVELALGTNERLVDVMQHITFDRKMDPVLAQQRDEKRRVIAAGLDLPAEVLLGIGETTNHWSAWLIDDQTWKGHLEPDVVTVCSQITTGYLRPKLLARLGSADGTLSPSALAAIDDLVVWYDEADVVNHPNRGQDALEVYNALELSGDALRQYKGFGETDKPTDEERAARVEQYRLMHARGAVPGEVTVQDVNDPSQGGKSAPVVSETVTKGPAQTGSPADTAPPTATTAALVAAGSPRPVAERLLSLDQRLRARVEAAADTATRRALQKAGNRIATKVSKQPALKATVAGVPRTHAAAVLGRSVVASLDLTDDELLDGCYDDFADQTDSWVDDTQQSALTVLVTDLRRNGVQIATVASTLALLRDRGQTPSTSLLLAALAESADGNLSASLRDAAGQVTLDREAGRTQLLSAMQDRARALLYSPDPMKAPERGEWDGTVLVSAGLIRGALNLYGGGRGDMPTDSLGVAYGARTAAVAQSGGYAVNGWTWYHGSPLRPFEPHELLDGMTFTNPDDPRLDAGDDAAWIESATGGFWPGDHDFCTCSVIPDLAFVDTAGDIAA